MAFLSFLLLLSSVEIILSNDVAFFYTDSVLCSNVGPFSFAKAPDMITCGICYGDGTSNPGCASINKPQCINVTNNEGGKQLLLTTFNTCPCNDPQNVYGCTLDLIDYITNKNCNVCPIRDECLSETDCSCRLHALPGDVNTGTYSSLRWITKKSDPNKAYDDIECKLCKCESNSKLQCSDIPADENDDKFTIFVGELPYACPELFNCPDPDSWDLTKSFTNGYCACPVCDPTKRPTKSPTQPTTAYPTIAGGCYRCLGLGSDVMHPCNDGSTQAMGPPQCNVCYCGSDGQRTCSKYDDMSDPKTKQTVLDFCPDLSHNCPDTNNWEWDTDRCDCPKCRQVSTQPTQPTTRYPTIQRECKECVGLSDDMDDPCNDGSTQPMGPGKCNVCYCEQSNERFCVGYADTLGNNDARYAVIRKCPELSNCDPFKWQWDTNKCDCPVCLTDKPTTSKPTSKPTTSSPTTSQPTSSENTGCDANFKCFNAVGVNNCGTTGGACRVCECDGNGNLICRELGNNPKSFRPIDVLIIKARCTAAEPCEPRAWYWPGPDNSNKCQCPICTAEPTTSKPTTSKPTTSKPTTSKPTTNKPTTGKPTTSKPTSKPTTAAPTTSKPTYVQQTGCSASDNCFNMAGVSVPCGINLSNCRYCNCLNDKLTCYTLGTNPKTFTTADVNAVKAMCAANSQPVDCEKDAWYWAGPNQDNKCPCPVCTSEPTSKPTTSKPTTSKPTNKPTTSEPTTTAKPTTSKPTPKPTKTPREQCADGTRSTPFITKPITADKFSSSCKCVICECVNKQVECTQCYYPESKNREFLTRKYCSYTCGTDSGPYIDISNKCLCPGSSNQVTSCTSSPFDPNADSDSDTILDDASDENDVTLPSPEDSKKGSDEPASEQYIVIQFCFTTCFLFDSLDRVKNATFEAVVSWAKSTNPQISFDSDRPIFYLRFFKFGPYDTTLVCTTADIKPLTIRSTKTGFRACAGFAIYAPSTTKRNVVDPDYINDFFTALANSDKFQEKVLAALKSYGFDDSNGFGNVALEQPEIAKFSTSDKVVEDFKYNPDGSVNGTKPTPAAANHIHCNLVMLMVGIMMFIIIMV